MAVELVGIEGKPRRSHRRTAGTPLAAFNPGDFPGKYGIGVATINPLHRFEFIGTLRPRGQRTQLAVINCRRRCADGCARQGTLR
jgi:hypothetical protein